MTDPITDTIVDPVVATAVEAAKAVVDNAQSLGLTWGLRAGTVTSDSELGSTTVQVTLDGDTAVLDVVSLLGPQLTGQRVMTMSVPPGGIFIIGIPAQDPWHEVGGEGEPDFSTGWSSFGSPFGGVGFRRTEDGHLEMTGLADFSSVTSAPALVFTLPDGWRPDRTVQFIASNNPGPTTTPTVRSIQIQDDGDVLVTNYAGSIDPGPISFDGIYFALRTGI